MKKRLTDKQILFFEEYLIDFNGTRSYIGQDFRFNSLRQGDFKKASI